MRTHPPRAYVASHIMLLLDTMCRHLSVGRHDGSCMSLRNLEKA